MTWDEEARALIERLRDGETVSFRPVGKSMAGIIESGQLVTIEPVKGDINVGDVVLCTVHTRHYVHLVKKIDTGIGDNWVRYQIGNNRGGINGWITRSEIHGRRVIPQHVRLAAQEFLVTCWDNTGEMVINTTYDAESAFDALQKYQVDQVREFANPSDAFGKKPTPTPIMRIEIKPVEI